MPKRKPTICAALNGEVFFGSDALDAIPEPPPPSPPETSEEIAYTLIDQLVQALHEVRDIVSTADLRAAFNARFPETTAPATLAIADASDTLDIPDYLLVQNRGTAGAGR